ncbi:MAG: HK97 gp10 family phage protein [Rhodobacteraceae bacterium]|nr:HK97 gp10 family phage protein [Paracoccaceae bacterium]MBR9821925.1 HK97 gp10 family phage protein [Paracoccaceae bacterium]
MKVDLKTHGWDDVEKALLELPKHTTRKSLVRRVLKRAAQIFADRANALAPRGPSGDLEDSYGVGTRLTKRQASTARREGRDDVFMYAGTSDPAGQQQEFGNAQHAAQPHARPAWDQTQQEIFDQIRDEMSVEVEKAVARARRKAARQARKS